MSNAFVRRLQSITSLQEVDKCLLEDISYKSRKFAPKKYVPCGGEDLVSFPVLLSGWAARYQVVRNGGRQITQLLLPGDSLFFGTHFSEAVNDEIVTLSACDIVNVYYSEIERAIRASPAICNAMLSYGCMENAIFASWVVNLGRRDAYERMAHLICELHHRLTFDQADEAEDDFLFPLTQEDFADVLGLTPVHINRKLQQMRQNNLISLRSKRMKIIDLPALKKIAGFSPSYLTQRSPAPTRWAALV